MVSDIESPALLSHPTIRRQMEEEMKEIAKGNIVKEAALIKNLDWFEDRYNELEESLTRDRVNNFGNNLGPTNKYLQYLQRLGAFEPKVKGTVVNNNSSNKQHHNNKKKPTHKRQSTNNARYKGRQKEQQNSRRGTNKVKQTTVS